MSSGGRNFLSAEWLVIVIPVKMFVIRVALGCAPCHRFPLPPPPPCQTLCSPCWTFCTPCRNLCHPCLTVFVLSDCRSLSFFSYFCLPYHALCLLRNNLHPPCPIYSLCCTFYPPCSNFFPYVVRLVSRVDLHSPLP